MVRQKGDAVRFAQATRALQVWISCLVLGAVAAGLRAPWLSGHDALVLAGLLGLAVFEAELGRHAEGGRVLSQRAHKGLSAWPFAAALLCGSSLAVLITAPTYAYVRWRGMKVPLHKWVGSAALLSLAAAAAQPLAPALHAPDAAALLQLLLAGVLFLAVETAGFAVCTVAGDPEDEKWLRTQLLQASFYLNEAFVLCQATVIALVWSASPVLVAVLLPSYAVLQRGLLHQTLRQAAETDAKTGLLLLHAWEQRAQAVLARGGPFSVLLLDLDHFKRVNDEHGHLVGDDVLLRTGELLRSCLRPQDVLGRFGGEEFIVLLPDADAAEARAVGERLRATLEATCFDGLALTVSVGVYASGPVEPARLREALACADVALYAAKQQGRNAVRTYRPSLDVPTQRTPVPVIG